MYFVNYNFKFASFLDIFELSESHKQYLSNGIGMVRNGGEMGEIWHFEVRMASPSCSGNCRRGAKCDLRSCAAIRVFVRLFRKFVGRWKWLPCTQIQKSTEVWATSAGDICDMVQFPCQM